ncbi:MAG: nucleotide kinase domain-containing protein [Candidatus Zixiibacteriota bacterium]
MIRPLDYLDLPVDLLPAQPTKAYNTFWRFAAERQAIFFRKHQHHSPPWTCDSVLRMYKFTNAYRAADRVSQYLIRRVIYEGDQQLSHVFFRVILFKLFNKIETWELLESQFGELSYSRRLLSSIDRALSKALANGVRVYSAAYIMPSGGTRFSTRHKHSAHLQLLSTMMEDSAYDRLASYKTMSQAFELLRSYPMIGDFLAYQFVTDLNYSTITDYSEMEFVVPGPGAKDGIAKCFSDLGGLTEPEIIRVVADRQESEFERLGLAFQSLWGRRLQLIDIQNLFCEVSKYTRVVHPEMNGTSGRHRIKQKYAPAEDQIEYWFPPKWNINVASDVGTGRN